MAEEIIEVKLGEKFGSLDVDLIKHFIWKANEYGLKGMKVIACSVLPMPDGTDQPMIHVRPATQSELCERVSEVQEQRNKTYNNDILEINEPYSEFKTITHKPGPEPTKEGI
jgi:hypothetical protein